MKSSLLLLAVFVTFLSCETSGKRPGAVERLVESAESPETNEASADSITQFLIAASALDFHKNATSGQFSFRNVRSGYVTADNGQKQYILCGEYMGPKNGDAWTQFTTIKTSDYELWLGSQGGINCDDPNAVWTHEEGLTSLLQSEFDGLR